MVEEEGESDDDDDGSCQPQRRGKTGPENHCTDMFPHIFIFRLIFLHELRDPDGRLRSNS